MNRTLVEECNHFEGILSDLFLLCLVSEFWGCRPTLASITAWGVMNDLIGACSIAVGKHIFLFSPYFLKININNSFKF